MSMSDVTMEQVSAARKMVSCSATSSSNAQLRKIKKPLIERRRRERINECLGQLKSLVLEATNKDESRYSKMEKADILEMTVAHLKFVHSSRYSRVCRAAEVPPVAAAADDVTSSGTTAGLRYLMGYNECVREVASYLAGDDSGDARGRLLGDDVRTSLMQHLDDCLRLRAAAPPIVAAVSRLPSPPGPGVLPCAGSPRRPVDIGPSSPLTVDSAPAGGATSPWRHRCDSGVYSGASSPAQAEEFAVIGALPSPLELTTRTTTQQHPTFSSDACQLLQPPLQTTSNVDASADVWRPW